MQEHEIFQRDGSNLYCDIPVSFVDIALGGELDVPTLEGMVKLKIPSETQTGKMFRIKGKGVKSIHHRMHGNQPGDLICKVIVETPVRLLEEQKKHAQKISTKS